MIDICLDYIDRRVFRKRESEIILPDKSRRLVADKLAVELFEKLGLEYEYNNSFKTVYNSKNKALWILSEDFESSVQHKGAFFNPANWKEAYDQTTEFLKDNQATHHITRLDLAFTTTENWFPLFKKIKFKNLLVKSYSRDGQLENITAENSRFEIVFYNKTKQLKKVRNEDYLSAFKAKYPQEQLYRLEIRLKGKDTIEKIPSLKNEKIHLGKVAQEVFLATDKRIGLPRQLKNKLLEAIYAIK